jgi:formate dehydrogenase accessory protein FdhE
MTNSNGPDYDARIGRAKYLAAAHPFAAEVLSFYQQLASFQKTIYSETRKASGNRSGARTSDPLRSDLNFVLLMAQFPPFLSFLESAGPQPIAEAARQLSAQEIAAWTSCLAHFWRVAGRRRHLAEEMQGDSAETLKEFILRSFLQPQVEFLAEGMPPPSVDGRPRHCPRCDSVPLLGVLRPEGDGGKRCLVCSFCFCEWEFRRILCPACGEEAENKLPIYVAEQLSHIRIEACDTCKSYLRTIDLTKNGRAIPIVDDLAAIPLSLWAEERGYTRLQPNLLRT